MEIEKDIKMFLEKGIEAIRPNDLDIVSVECPNPGCHHRMRFPIIARQCDIEAIKEIIEIANKYLNENGVIDKILCDLMDRINLSLTIKKALDE